MKLTRERVNKLHELNDEVIKAESVASEILRTAQDQTGHVEHELDREDPKTGETKRIKLSEKILWEEVFYLGGTGHAAANILRKEHPEVFDAYKTQEDAAKKLQEHVRAEMEIDIKKMRISDYVRLTEAMIDLKLEERKEGIDRDADGNVKSPIQGI
jgi:hypothetical protein